MLIETLPAAFEMDEDSLRAARPHRRPQLRPLGLYLLVHQTPGQEPRLPHPRSVGNDDGQGVPQRLLAPAHQDSATAAARSRWAAWPPQIPVKGDEQANEAAFAKVRADKEREATNGHDGTWVAHPDLVPIAMEVFDRLHARPQPALGQARRRSGDRRPSSSRSIKASAPKRACAKTFGSGCNISRPGSGAAAPCRSTT